MEMLVKGLQLLSKQLELLFILRKLIQYVLCKHAWMVMKLKNLKMLLMNVTLLLLQQEIKILLEKTFLKMKSYTIVCNIGHFDNEIDMNWLNSSFGKTKEEIKPQVDQYEINDKIIVLLRQVSKFRMCYWPSKFCDE